MRDMLILFPLPTSLAQASVFLDSCSLHISGTYLYLPGVAYRIPWGMASPHAELQQVFADQELQDIEVQALENHQSLLWLRPLVESVEHLQWVENAIDTITKNCPGFYAQHCGRAVLSRDWIQWRNEEEGKPILDGLLKLGWEKGLLRTLGMEALNSLPDLAVACQENAADSMAEVLLDLAYNIFIEENSVVSGDYIETSQGEFKLRREASSPFPRGDVLRNQSGTWLLVPR